MIIIIVRTVQYHVWFEQPAVRGVVYTVIEVGCCVHLRMRTVMAGNNEYAVSSVQPHYPMHDCDIKYTCTL